MGGKEERGVEGDILPSMLRPLIKEWLEPLWNVNGGQSRVESLLSCVRIRKGGTLTPPLSRP